MSLFSGEEENYAVLRFESMLKKNHVFFFEVEEFEEIIGHYLDLGKMNKAKHALGIGLQQHPMATSLKLLQVEILIFEDQLKEASVILEQLFVLEPSNSEVYVQQANLYSKLKNHQKAIELLQQAMKYTDDVADICSLMAMEYLFMEEYSKAKSCFIRCLKEDSQDYMSLQQLIYCYDVLEQSQECIAFLNQFLNQSPYCEIAWYYLGKQYIHQENLQEALRCFDFAIISDDTFTGAYFEKAKVLEMFGEYQKAIENYKITLTLDDASPLVFLHIGKCYEKMNDDESAEKYYFKAVQEDPQLSKSWMNLSEFYYLRGEFAKSLKYLYKVLQLEEENPFYWKRYAEINLAVNDLKKAEQAFGKAVAFGDYSLDTISNWLDLLLLHKQYRQVIEIISDVEYLFPNEITFEYRLAVAYWGINNFFQAQKHLSKAIEKGWEWVPFFNKKFPDFFRTRFVREMLQ
ncbi:tetratricopeptide repeat protein [Capnocytophaga canimorsus]|uniref:tetratricopeptide repeat protein n=1 Tax=Capnocytophaga canimorsus TaxID=28188 RepID=UPI0037CCEE67